MLCGYFYFIWNEIEKRKKKNARRERIPFISFSFWLHIWIWCPIALTHNEFSSFIPHCPVSGGGNTNMSFSIFPLLREKKLVSIISTEIHVPDKGKAQYVIVETKYTFLFTHTKPFSSDVIFWIILLYNQNLLHISFERI